MENTIRRYNLKVTKRQEVEIPRFAEILTVQLINDMPCLFAMVEPQNEPEKRTIDMFLTGEYILTSDEERRRYISTVQFEHGETYHYFEYCIGSLNLPI